jgi:hypothetical protein
MSTLVMALVLTSVLNTDAQEAIYAPPTFTSQLVAAPGSAAPSSAGHIAFVERTDGAMLCVWDAGKLDSPNAAGAPLSAGMYASTLPKGGKEWTIPRTLDLPDHARCPVLYVTQTTIKLFFTAPDAASPDSPAIFAADSTDGGQTWSAPMVLMAGKRTSGKIVALPNGHILMPLSTFGPQDSVSVARSEDGGKTWAESQSIDRGTMDGHLWTFTSLLRYDDGVLVAYMSTPTKRNRVWRSLSVDDGKTWTKASEIEVPNRLTSLDSLLLPSGHIVMALNPAPDDRNRLALWLSQDMGGRWTVYRDAERGDGVNISPSLLLGSDGNIHMVYAQAGGAVKHAVFNEAWVWQDALIHRPYPIKNVLSPLIDEDDEKSLMAKGKRGLVTVGKFEEHVRGRMTEDEAKKAEAMFAAPNSAGLIFPQNADVNHITSRADRDGKVFVGTTKGLYSGDAAQLATRHESYGVDGPLATRINALAFDSKGTLWIGTPLGLSLLKPDGTWSHIRGKQGLPVEDVTAIAVDEHDRLWIGTSHGAIHYRPYESGRQWFYRAGYRYLHGDKISAVALAPGGMPAYFNTDGGVCRIDAVVRTLQEKADLVEARLNKFHRRLGLVAACTLDDAENPTSSYIIDDDNDGLWTSYHVVAMASAYAATGNEAYRESAKKGMDALVMLQNASGTPGLVARSVLPKEEGLKKREDAKDHPRRDMREQWQPTPDGEMYWKSDTSSDEIDGHYFAFYAYWQHIAQFIPEERALIEKQVRAVTDYIAGNNYQLIDWDGERTTWGYWNPETINGDPGHFGDNGLNSLEILSFLKTTFLITGDPKYKEHYEKLICDHGYLDNVQLEKKYFPDNNNHSDNQLGYVAWYPILQMEWDPKVREILNRAVRRHYRIIAMERSSFFNFVTATIDPKYVDITGAIENLKEISTDRRLWTMLNSHRADVIFQDRLNRHGDAILTRVLPADERNWNRWNVDPFVPDGGGKINQHVAGSPLSPHNVRSFGQSLGGEGRTEDDGGSFLLSYWIARCHGFIKD